MHIENICELIHLLHSRQIAAKFCSRLVIASMSFACISRARSPSSASFRRKGAGSSSAGTAATLC